METTDLIRKDHEAVKTLFRKFESARGAEKQKIAQQIIAELSVHAEVEEQLLYPLLREADDANEDDVLEALEEHHAAKLTLLELDKMKVDHERYDAKMTVLRESIEHHIEEEESDLLPRVDRLLSEEQDLALAQELTALKAAVPDHPHPMAPDEPPGNFMSAGLAKILDMGKNLARAVTSPGKAEGQQRAKKRAAEQARQTRAKAKGRTAASTANGTGKKKKPAVSTKRRATSRRTSSSR